MNIFSQAIRKIFLVLVILMPGKLVFAQSEMFGTWTGINIEKKANKWDLGAETEVRTIYFIRLIDRWSFGLNADYNLSKQIKLGLGYQFMSSLDYDPDYQKSYFIRNRFYTTLNWKLKLNDFTVRLRERIQLTQKEERIQIDGTIDEYKINPALSWRNRMQISYNIPHSKITPSISLESFYELNNPEGNSFDNLRYMLNLDYKLNKHNNVEIYGVINSEQNSDDATGKYILGIGYKYSF